MKSNDGMKRRLESEQQSMKRITNNDLVCRSCMLKFDDSKKFGNTSKCEVYEVKPNNVLLGGECDEYIKA